MKKAAVVFSGVLVLLLLSFLMNYADAKVIYHEIEGSENNLAIEADSLAVSGEEDAVIILTRNGKPFLPDLERVAGKRQTTTNEIAFTFDSTDDPWDSEELATLNQWVKNFYPAIKKIYGSPAFNITVNVKKNPASPYVGTYNCGINEIELRRLQADVLVHEILHAFRDDLMLGFSVWEEGMVRGAEVEVMNLFPDIPYTDRYHSYGIDLFYELNNQAGLASKYGSFGMGFINPLMLCNQSGYVWWKIYFEKKSFFVDFNSKYYALAYVNPRVSIDIEVLKGLVRDLKRTVAGRSFDEWFSAQEIMNLNPQTGYQVVFKADFNTFYVYRRDEFGYEYNLAGVPVAWEIYDSSETLIADGSELTSENGFVEFQKFFGSYVGRLRIDVHVYLPDAVMEKTYFSITDPFPSPFAGIFGIIKDNSNGCYGEVSVNGKRASIVNCAFWLPELSRPGTYTIKHGKYQKTFTKDGPYFVDVP